jgi:hypothetical protein
MRSFVVEEPRSGALRALNYAPAVERIRRAGSASSRTLREIAKEFGPAYGTVFTRLDCDPNYGVELLSQGDMFAAKPRGRVIRRDSMREPRRHLIEPGQVLIAGAGTLGESEIYGRALIADDRLIGKYVGPDAMTLVFDDPSDDFSLFAYAWLACATGVNAVRSTSYGTKILRFRTDLLTSLPVPLADPETVRRVAALVRRTVDGRGRFVSSMHEAQRYVEERHPELRIAGDMLAGRHARFVLSTGPFPSIRAWNFAAGGGAIAYLRSTWQGSLGEALRADGAFNGPRFVRAGCAHPHGHDFLSQRDVFMIRPVGKRIAHPGIPDHLLFVPRDALLVGSTGQVTQGSLFGQVELASFAGWRCAITQHILRLLPAPGLREFLYTILSTSVGQAMLRSTAYGTSIPSMRIDLVLKLPLPVPSDAELKATQVIVAAAESARIQADEAESEAIRIVEQEVLPQWLA